MCHTLSSYVDIFSKNFRVSLSRMKYNCNVTDYIWRYIYDVHENFPIFKTPTPSRLSTYVQNSSIPLTLDLHGQTNFLFSKS